MFCFVCGVGEDIGTAYSKNYQTKEREKDKTMGFLEGIFAATLAPLILVIGFVLWDKLWNASAIMLNITKSSVAATLFIFIAVLQAFVKYRSGVNASCVQDLVNAGL